MIVQMIIQGQDQCWCDYECSFDNPGSGSMLMWLWLFNPDFRIQISNQHACDYDCSFDNPGSIRISDSKLTINIDVNINIEDGCRPRFRAGALPPNPHAFGGTGFFYTGAGCQSHFNPPPLRAGCLSASRVKTKPSSSRAQAPSSGPRAGLKPPQGLLKPSSRRVKESFTGSLRIVQLKDIQNVSIWSTI